MVSRCTSVRRWKSAVHGETNEIRKVLIPSEEANDPSKWASAWRRVFEKLGIWELVYRGSVHRHVLSSRHPQAWPIFTQTIIPRLYEYLIPQYKKPGYYSQGRDKYMAGPAQFPKELLEDMLLILRFEYPEFFADANVSQLKAIAHRGAAIHHVPHFAEELCDPLPLWRLRSGRDGSIQYTL
jgi:hypothetical protein